MDPLPTRYAFRDFVLEPAERRLQRDGVAVDLPAKIFDVLTLLVRRAGHLVGKDEFHATLWPRQVVSEATLNKYVWQLRRALGENEAEAKLIETVPRQGYRFVAAVRVLDDEDAAVTVAEAVAPVASTLPPSTAAAGRRWPVFAAGAALAAIAAVTLLSFRGAAPADTATALPPAASAPLASAAARSAIALAPAELRDGLPDWLGIAVPELLSRELAVSEQLRVLSRDAAAFDAPTPANDDRARCDTLGADVLLLPTLERLPGGGRDGVQLRLRLLDCARGGTLADLVAAGSDAHLDLLVATAGERVRTALGLNPLSDSLVRVRNASLPQDSATARRYAEAIGALSAHRDADALAALDEVTQREPGFVVAWLERARAELDQGYTARAAATARTGLTHAAAALRELRLSLEAVQAEADGAWTRAVETYEALQRFFPDQPDYALRLMSAQLSADDKPAAERTLSSLRELPGLADDARVLLAEFQLARGSDDWTRAHAVATRLLARADALRSDALHARALSLRGMASISLRDNAAADADLQAARSAFTELRDGNGLARSDLLLGNLRLMGGELDAAERHYRAAVDGYRELGARWNENVALDNLLGIAIARGDPVAARVPVEELLASTRTLGDTLGEARALVYLAWVELDAGHTDAALAAYREAARLNERAGNRAEHAATLASLANLLGTTGRDDEARTVAQQALEIADALDDTRYRVIALKAVAQAAHGDGIAARAAYAQARALTTAAEDAVGIARIDLGLADLDLAAGDAQAALDRLAQAEPALADIPRDRVTLLALRARAFARLKNSDAAQTALAGSRAAADATPGYLDHLPFRLAEVEVLVARGDTMRARTLAEALRVELDARHFARERQQLDGALRLVAATRTQ